MTMVPLDPDLISVLVKDHLPEFIRDEYPNFVAFLEAYYEYLEQFPGPSNIIHNHQRFVDVDQTIDQFLYHFRNKFLPDIPENIVADPRKLAKHIRDFYEARGTEKSYKFLFRILYNKDVDFYYPKDDLLIYNDGKWVEDIILFVQKCNDDSDPFLFERVWLTGVDSQSRALVDVVRQVNEGKYTVYQLLLNEVVGEFIIGERVTATLDDGTTVCGLVMGFVSGFTVTNAGLQYNVGDIVPIIDATGNGVNALGRVSKVFDPGNITRVDVLQPGSGYRVGDPVIFDESFTNGFGAEAIVTQVTPDVSITTDITIIGTVQNVVLDTIDHIVIEDYVQWETFTLGGIEEITVTDGGQNYNVLPTATVGQQTPTYSLPAGTGAVVQPANENAGAIAEIAVINPGVGYIEHPLWPKANLTITGDGTGTANVHVSGGPYRTGGYYKNYDGHYNSLKYIQDGEYYQLYSYVLKVDEAVNTYRDVVKQLVHPAGLKMFGLIDIVIPIKATAFVAGNVLPEHHTLYIIKFEFVADTAVELVPRGKSEFVVKFDIAVKTRHPIFIYHYEDEIIGCYQDVILQDHPGFNDQRQEYNRSAVVTIT